MKTSLLALAIGVLFTQTVFAQHLETNITLRNEKGAYATVLLGYDKNATKGLDPSLGEFAIPGFPPYPAGLQAALAYKDNGLAVLSYRDFRPMPTSFPLQDSFSLITTPASDDSRGSSLIFTWAYPLTAGLDSVVISDLFGGIVYRCTLDAREADTVKGNALNLEAFRIVLYSTKLTTAVSSDKFNDNVGSASQTPINLMSARLCIPEGISDETTFLCTDVTGSSTIHVSHGRVLDLTALTAGVYAVTSLQPDYLYRRLVVIW